MKVLFSTLSFSKVSFFDALTFFNKQGIKYIESTPRHLGFFSKKIYRSSYVKDIILEKNIKIISLQSIFHTYRNKVFDKNFIKNNLNHFEKVLKLSKFYSIKNISVGNIPSRRLKFSTSDLEKINKILFNKFSNISKKYNINLNIEPIHNKYNIFFLNNLQQTHNFLTKNKFKNIKLLLDVGNLLDNNQNFRLTFDKYNNFINHIHISERNLKKFNIERIDEILNYLIAENYKKTVSIEYLSDNGKGITEIISFIKRNYNKYL